MQASTGARSGQFDSGIDEPTMRRPRSDIEHLGDPNDRSLLPVQRVELFPGRSRLRSWLTVETVPRQPGVCGLSRDAGLLGDRSHGRSGSQSARDPRSIANQRGGHNA